MLKPKTRWDIAALSEAAELAAASIARELGLAPLTARLMVRRGILDAETARRYLNGGPELMHDPFLLRDMDAAVGRIRQAAERGEYIRIYGDYDADGVSSTAFVARLFASLGYRFDYYVPHRTLEGYGLNEKAIEAAAEAGVKLFVTVDNGISAVDQIAYARSLGIDTVVTDHHEPPERLPEAVAVVNPKRPDCPYPFKGLAGVGVAFKLGHALLGRPPLEWAELAALGTIADLMPLQDENRILARIGLDMMRRSDNPGFQALAKVGGMELHTASAEAVAFGMAPRVNAGGRLSRADIAVKLLTTDDPAEAQQQAETLDALNRERQKLVETMVREAEAVWAAKRASAAESGMREPEVIVVAGEDWNVGVVGIVASKLVERYYKPAFVLGLDAAKGTAKGSARSIDGFDLHAALTACEELLDHYGGHQAAAGMTLNRDRLPAFEERLDRLAREWLSDDDRLRKTTVDLVCSVEEASLEATSQIALLEPFGAGNPQPRILIEGVRLKEKRAIGKEGKHLRLAAQRGGGVLEAVGFGFGGLAVHIADSARVDLLGELSVNEWNGARKPQLQIRDLRVAHVQVFDGRGARDKRRTLERLLETAGSMRGAASCSGSAAHAAVVLAYDPGWLETAAASGTDGISVNGPMMFRYDDWPTEGLDCSTLVLLDKPPCRDGFAAIVRSCASLERVHVLYETATGREVRFPDRSDFGAAYRLLRRMNRETQPRADAIAALSRTGLPAETLGMMLDVFADLGFLETADGRIRLVPNPEHRELASSPVYERAKRGADAERLWSAPCAELTEWIIGIRTPGA